MANKVSVDYESIHQKAIVIDTHCDTLGQVFEGERRLLAVQGVAVEDIQSEKRLGKLR